MGQMSLTGNDTVIINGRILTAFAEGDTGAFTFPNKLVEAKVGKNGNAIFAFNAQGLLSEATLRLIRGSADDKFLNSLQKSYINDPAGFTLIAASFIKRAGDGKGNVTNDTYTFGAGVLPNLPEVKENVSGETEQAVSIWKFTFANSDRSMG
jgi:hypothetical protein